MRRRVGADAEERRALRRQQLEENPEAATLEEHRQAWERERGVLVSVSTMRAGRSTAWGGPTSKDAGSLRTGRGGPGTLA